MMVMKNLIKQLKLRNEDIKKWKKKRKKISTILKCCLNKGEEIKQGVEEDRGKLAWKEDLWFILVCKKIVALSAFALFILFISFFSLSPSPATTCKVLAPTTVVERRILLLITKKRWHKLSESAWKISVRVT